MKLQKTILATLLAASASGVFAAPAMQTCAPLEVAHNGSSGLSYVLTCEAGPWHLQYTGSVPAGSDAVNSPYRLAVSGPDGAFFTQNRTVRLPAPAKLGQILMREAVLLDNNELALRDCKELGCTQYRPLVSANSLAKASVTLPPETKRLQDEKKVLQQEIDRLVLAMAEAKTQAEQAKEAAVAEERRQAAAALASAQADYAELNTKLTAQNQEDVARADQKFKADQAASAKWIVELETEVQQLTAQLVETTKALELAQSEASAAKSDLAAAQQSLTQLRQSADAERAAYDFALADLVSQHNDQLAALKRELPDTDFKGVADELRVPKVNAAGLPAVVANMGLPASEAENSTANKTQFAIGPASGDEPVEPVKTSSKKKVGSKTGAKDKESLGPVTKKSSPHRYERYNGQWYDIRANPPTPVTRAMR